METPIFVPFPKLARLNRGVLVTEKMDGTNASIHIDQDGGIRAGSRTRWITPEDDNFGFAAWVRDNERALVLGLGPGAHFGEWWGAGIQRRYDQATRRFSLFNAHRWGALGEPPPSCCEVVPVLYKGPFEQDRINDCVALLRADGSVAVPGFMRPEGIVAFHEAAQIGFKVTLERDHDPKGKWAKALAGEP